MGDERIDKHVRGTSIERKDLLRFRRGGDHGEVRDAAEVQGDAAEFFVAIEKIVGVGNERRALSAESHVGGTKIADGGDAGACSNDGWIADLQRRGGRPAQVGNRLALMKN